MCVAVSEFTSAPWSYILYYAKVLNNLISSYFAGKIWNVEKYIEIEHSI